MEIVLIAARSKNGIIGRAKGLPWQLPADMAHFRKLTMGAPVLMGRKTWESLTQALPGRRNLVVTRKKDYVARGAEVFADIEYALLAADGETPLFVIGGEDIYRQTLGLADRLLITEVDTEVQGDACFPGIDPGCFDLVAQRARSADAENAFAMTFCEYRRRRVKVLAKSPSF